jgi:hypothetical protein
MQARDPTASWLLVPHPKCNALPCWIATCCLALNRDDGGLCVQLLLPLLPLLLLLLSQEPPGSTGMDVLGWKLPPSSPRLLSEPAEPHCMGLHAVGCMKDDVKNCTPGVTAPMASRHWGTRRAACRALQQRQGQQAHRLGAAPSPPGLSVGAGPAAARPAPPGSRWEEGEGRRGSATGCAQSTHTKGALAPR